MARLRRHSGCNDGEGKRRVQREKTCNDGDIGWRRRIRSGAMRSGVEQGGSTGAWWHREVVRQDDSVTMTRSWRCDTVRRRRRNDEVTIE